jgi:putative MATE family efflux protein
MQTQEQKTIKMTTEPVEKLVSTLAVPTIISMLITSFYNMADTFFVGHISDKTGNATNAVGAVGVSFALMAMIQACGFFFGHGSGNFISRELGAKKYDSAERMASTAFFTAFGFGIVLSAVGLIFLEPLAILLGGTKEILPLEEDYLRYILIGAPFMTSSLVLNNQLRFQGSAAFGMIGMGFGAVLNIALDPLLIFYFEMGVAGAALATIISQFCSFVILCLMTLRGNNINIRISKFTPSIFYYKKIIQGGLPSLCRQGLGSIATMSLNNSAGAFGEVAIAGMSIVSRTMLFANSVVIGFGQGFQPVCGFNFGAKLYTRVKKAFLFCLKTGFIFMCIASVIMYIFAPEVIALFRDDKEVIKIGVSALRCQCITFPITSLIVFSNMMLQTIGLAGRASFLAMSRQGLMFIPFILLLPRVMGLSGVFYAQPIADVLAFIVAIPLTVSVLKTFKEDKV